MHRSAYRVAVVLVLAGFGCSPRGGDAAAAIRKADAAWLEAAKARDVDRAVAFWADDATVLPPGGPALVGKAAIRDYVDKSFRTPGFAISWTTDDVVVSRSGDLAYATGTNRVTFTGPDGREVVVPGKAVTVWRRDARGDWKCIVDIWNDQAPPGR